MTEISTNQPLGTPTWVDLAIPDLARAMDFYGAVLGWEFVTGSVETGRYTICRVGGKAVAGIMPHPDADATDFWWNVYLATDDCDATVQRVIDTAGSVINPPMDIMDQGRMAVLRDPAGSQFGLWQGRALVGAERVMEPGTLVRNDLIAQDPEGSAGFYATVFDFVPERNTEIPGMDFLALIRPDGHDVGGIFAADEDSTLGWDTTFEVDEVNTAVQRVRTAGGQATEPRTSHSGGSRPSPIRSESGSACTA